MLCGATVCTLFACIYMTSLSGTPSRTLTKDRRTRVYNIRLSGDESERFRRVAESRGLDVAQLVRMLVALADRGPDDRQLPPERAGLAWEAAQQAFRQSGIAEALPVHVVNTPHLQVTLVALAAAVGAAVDAREGEAAAVLNRFRIAVAAMPALNGRERGPNADTRGIWLAYLDAAREMFGWRRNFSTRCAQSTLARGMARMPCREDARLDLARGGARLRRRDRSLGRRWQFRQGHRHHRRRQHGQRCWHPLSAAQSAKGRLRGVPCRRQHARPRLLRDVTWRSTTTSRSTTRTRSAHSAGTPLPSATPR